MLLPAHTQVHSHIHTDTYINTQIDTHIHSHLNICTALLFLFKFLSLRNSKRVPITPSDWKPFKWSSLGERVKVKQGLNSNKDHGIPLSRPEEQTTYTENNTGGPGRNCVERGKSKALSNIYILCDSVCKSLKNGEMTVLKSGSGVLEAACEGRDSPDNDTEGQKSSVWFQESKCAQTAQNITPESPLTSDSARELHPHQSPELAYTKCNKGRIYLRGNHLRLLGNLSTFATSDKCIMTFK